MSGKTGLAGFNSSKGGAMWEPRQDANKQPYTADGSSYLKGYYLGTKEGVGQNNSKIHEFHLLEAGNDAHVVGELVNNKVGVWGTGVLDSLIADSGIVVGVCVAVIWKGKVSTKDGSKTYHDWDFGTIDGVEPLSLGSVASAPQMDAQPTAAPQNAPVDAVTEMNNADEDDLPF